MTPHLRSALIRSILVTIMIVVWIVFFDGPSWGWAMLAVYIGCTFGVAMFLQTRVMPKPPEPDRAKDDDA